MTSKRDRDTTLILNGEGVGRENGRWTAHDETARL